MAAFKICDLPSQIHSKIARIFRYARSRGKVVFFGITPSLFLGGISTPLLGHNRLRHNYPPLGGITGPQGEAQPGKA